MDSPQLTRAQSREIDRRAIEDYGFSGLVLMENAGRGCVDVLEKLELGPRDSVAILCGKGNNAGDGFVTARHLAIRGHVSRVLLLCPPAELRGDAAANFAILMKCNVPIIDLSSARAGLLGTRRGETSTSPAELLQRLDDHARGAAWLVDAMLGTGAQGEPRAPFDAAIDWLNTQRPPARVLAIDVPSGLDCDTGLPAAHTVRADHTATFAAMKIGFVQPAAKEFTGTVHVCDIGLPQALITEI